MRDTDASPPAFVETNPVDSDDNQTTHSTDGYRDVKSKWAPQALIRNAERSHSRLPGIRKVPFRAIAVIFIVGLINVVVWIAVAIVLVCMLCCPASYCWVLRG